MANRQCVDLMVTTDGNWASGGLRAVLPAGNSFYNHPLGTNTKPSTGNFSRTSQVTPDSTTEIPDVPEPGALAIMSAAALALVRRRGAGVC